MTIALSANTPRISYTVAQGVTRTTPFDTDFVFFTGSTDVNVFVDGVARTFDASTSNTTLFTVSGGSGSTGSVTTTVTGATGGSTVLITRSVPLSRTTDFPSSGAFEISKLNTELDTVFTLIADADDENSRALRLKDSDSAVDLTLPLKADRVGTVLGFNATTGAAEAGPTIANVSTLTAITGNINTLGGISADITTLAHIEDGTTASNAIQTVATNANAVVTVSQNTTNMTNITNNLSAIQNASANATLAEGYAVKVDGAVESSKYSSKAWAIGGTGVTDTAGSGSAKSWAVEADAVDGTEFSSKVYAASGSTLNVGSAKNWALGGGDSFSTSTTIGNTGLYSAKYWAEQSALSKTEFSNIYQGTHSSDPSGGSVSAGDLYFNSSSNVLKFYTGSAWSTVEAVDTSALASNGFAVAMAIAL